MAEWLDHAIGLLATACKLDERQIHATTLVHFRRLERYWKKYPPEHLIGRAFIKIRDGAGEAVPATKISPDLRPKAEREADAARVAALKAKAPKRSTPAAPLAQLAGKNGGQVTLDMLRGM